MRKPARLEPNTKYTLVSGKTVTTSAAVTSPSSSEGRENANFCKTTFWMATRNHGWYIGDGPYVGCRWVDKTHDYSTRGEWDMDFEEIPQQEQLSLFD